jgi:BirA family biotin operon repressor/biotin-[acetyl-CoA-carboxylase] ligase
VLDELILRESLPIGFLGSSLHVLEKVDSTNSEAKRMAALGASEGTLIVAREQTAGRGRGDNIWYSQTDRSLTFSVILKPEGTTRHLPGVLSLLGALAVSSTLSKLGFISSIKWPNDVLLDGRKVAGVLVEASWIGDSLEWAILGIGINVRQESLPDRVSLDYPGITIEDSYRGVIDLNRLLLAVLKEIGFWYTKLGSEDLRNAWEDRLAFIGEAVEVIEAEQRYQGKLLGVSPQGNLILDSVKEGIQQVPLGAGQLRPVDNQ